MLWDAICVTLAAAWTGCAVILAAGATDWVRRNWMLRPAANCDGGALPHAPALRM